MKLSNSIEFLRSVPWRLSTLTPSTMNIIQVVTAFLGFLPLVLAQSMSIGSVNFHPRLSNGLFKSIRQSGLQHTKRYVRSLLHPFHDVSSSLLQARATLARLSLNDKVVLVTGEGFFSRKPKPCLFVEDQGLDLLDQVIAREISPQSRTSVFRDCACKTVRLVSEMSMAILLFLRECHDGSSSHVSWLTSAMQWYQRSSLVCFQLITIHVRSHGYRTGSTRRLCTSVGLPWVQNSEVEVAIFSWGPLCR